MIVLRSPKGWTGPAEVDGLKTEGYWRSHQVPLAELKAKPGHIALLEEWMKSYRPEELFAADGSLVPELAELAPKGNRRMGANPLPPGRRRHRPGAQARVHGGVHQAVHPPQADRAPSVIRRHGEDMPEIRDWKWPY